jgi:DNA-binding NarL/FixJ family response regulator
MISLLLRKVEYMETKKRVLIIDQQPAFRKGLKALVDENSAYRCIAEAGCGREGMELARRNAPDIVIMDLSLPDMSGMGAVRELKRLAPPAKILVLSACAKYDKITNALRAGAKGFAVKHAINGSILEAMDTIGQGNYYLDDEVYQEVLISMLTRAA